MKTLSMLSTETNFIPKLEFALLDARRDASERRLDATLGADALICDGYFEHGYFCIIERCIWDKKHKEA